MRDITCHALKAYLLVIVLRKNYRRSKIKVKRPVGHLLQKYMQELING